MPRYYPEDKLIECLNRSAEIHCSTWILIEWLKREVPAVEMELPHD